MTLRLSPIFFVHTAQVYPIRFGNVQPEFDDATPPPANSIEYQRLNRLFIDSKYFDKDWKWARAMDKVIRENAILIQNGTIYSYEQLAKRTLDAYGDYFKNKNSFEDYRRGIPRQKEIDYTTTLISDLNNKTLKYYDYLPRIKILFNQYKKQVSNIRPLSIEHDKTADHSHYLINKTHFKNTTIEWTVTELQENNYALWHHTNPIYFPIIKKLLDNTFSHYLKLLKVYSYKNPTKLKILTKQIARIHWMQASLVPTFRGSAGIADIISKSLFEAAGMDAGCWKPGIQPDCEAFVTPDIDEYAKNYPSFFTRPPRFVLNHAA